MAYMAPMAPQWPQNGPTMASQWPQWPQWSQIPEIPGSGRRIEVLIQFYQQRPISLVAKHCSRYNVLGHV